MTITMMILFFPLTMMKCPMMICTIILCRINPIVTTTATRTNAIRFYPHENESNNNNNHSNTYREHEYFVDGEGKIYFHRPMWNLRQFDRYIIFTECVMIIMKLRVIMIPSTSGVMIVIAIRMMAIKTISQKKMTMTNTTKIMKNIIISSSTKEKGLMNQDLTYQ